MIRSNALPYTKFMLIESVFLVMLSVLTAGSLTTSPKALTIAYVGFLLISLFLSGASFPTYLFSILIGAIVSYVYFFLMHRFQDNLFSWFFIMIVGIFILTKI